MAKRNEQTTGANDQAPVKAPTKWTSEGLEIQHDARRRERRELELELGAIDEKMRNAISSGDLSTLANLMERKAELPNLFIAASLEETNARHEVFNAADEKNLDQLHSAEAARDELQAALEKLRRDFEAKSAALTERLQQANQSVGESYSELAASRDHGASCDAGFRRSLAALAGV